MCPQPETYRTLGSLDEIGRGLRGVSWVPKAGKWKSFICASHKYIYLGLFSDIDDAIAARKAAEAKYHPFAPKDSQHA